MADGTVVFATELDQNGIKNGLTNLNKSVNKWGAAIVGSKAFAAISEGIIKVAKAGIEYNAQMEAYETNFSVLLGDEAAALEHVAELREMAAKTPFGMEDLSSANQTLLSFGMSADESIDAMQRLGDISLGNKDRFSSLSLAFAQVSSAGKLTGQDLNQMINAGFNPLNTIAEKTGTNIADLKDVMSGGKGSRDFQKQIKAAQKEVKKMGAAASESAQLLAQIGTEGAISAELVGIAMELETSPGGKFYNGMEKASQTMQGMWSTLQDDASQLAGNAMQSLSGVLTDHILPAAINAVGALNDLFDSDGTVQISADIQGAIDDLSSLDSEVTRILNDYTGAKINIQITYEEVTDVISQLEEKITSLENTPKRLWSDQDKDDLRDLTNQLVELNPAFTTLVGKDGIIKTDIDAIKSLAEEYRNLALEQAALEARTEVYEAIVNAQHTRDNLVERVELIREEQAATNDLSRQWGELVQATSLLNAGPMDQGPRTFFSPFMKNADIINQAISAIQQYIDLADGLNAQLFTDAGISLSAFMDGMTFKSAEEILSNADALSNFEAAYRLVNQLSTEQISDIGAVLEQQSTDIAASEEAILSAEKSIADSERELQILDRQIAKLKGDVSEQTSDAIENISEVEAAGEKLGEQTYAPELNVDDHASSAIDEITAKGEEFASKEFVATARVRTIANFASAFNSLVPKSHMHKTGLDYVPYDNYLALLHQGERVLTAEESRALDRMTDPSYASRLASRTFAGGVGASAGGSSAAVVNQTINFNQPVRTPYEFAQLLKEQQTYGLAGQ